ncbi:MAG: HAD family hydrolase [Armatimonadetes bacterium]|nr:HAD family hydrolase [Armatimonadota bacterium]
MPLAAVVFDFDGTLAATNIDFSLMRRRVVEVLKRHCAWDERLAQGLWTLEMIEAAADCMRRKGKDPAAMVREAYERIEAVEIAGCSGARLVDDAEPAMRRLVSSGLRLGIITRNCRRAVNMVLGRHDVPASVVLPRDDAPAVKPNPAHLLAACQALGCSPAETVLVGDHVSDVQCARAAGAIPVAVARASSSAEELAAAGAEYIAQSLTEATEWILRQMRVECGPAPSQPSGQSQKAQ